MLSTGGVLESKNEGPTFVFCEGPIFVVIKYEIKKIHIHKQATTILA